MKDKVFAFNIVIIVAITVIIVIIIVITNLIMINHHVMMMMMQLKFAGKGEGPELGRIGSGTQLHT